MPDLHLEVFCNEDRPTHFQDPSFEKLPLDVLGPELTSQLRNSLTVNADGRASAASARLWESLLEKHRLPYLLLIVADMRSKLDSKVTALPLYEELHAMLPDLRLDFWLSHFGPYLLDQAERQLMRYKNDPLLGFTPSQRWRPTAEKDPFPYCKLQRAQINAIRDRWANIESKQGIMAKLQNMHCLETNFIEGTFLLDEDTGGVLVQCGFYDQEKLIDLPNPVGGAVRDISDALSILQDTHEALNEIVAFVKPDAPNLTVEIVCRLHAKLMRTSRVLYAHTGYGPRLSYLNIGTTRQASRVNVTATSPLGIKIQFCPYDEVDEELETFCERFNELIGQTDSMDPFASAAWISHVFVTIHPFEDGNGRLSRILSSIPLLKSGLPLLCVPAFFKSSYHNILNSIRANRDGDYKILMEEIYDAVETTLDVLEVTG
ncbi:fido domain-containing protein [Pholiota molesta]|nr:fido domain-containing protein [Pholiota molesta]